MFSAINHLAPPRFHRNLRNLKPSIALPARGVRDGSGRKLPSNPEGRSRAPQPYLRPLSNRTEFLWTTYQRWGRSKLLPPPRLRSTQLECQFRKCWRRGQWPPSLRKHQVSRPREIEACHAPCERGRAADERFRPACHSRAKGELRRQYEQRPDKDADADHERGDGIYPSEPHGTSPQGLATPVTGSNVAVIGAAQARAASWLLQCSNQWRRRP